MKRILPILILCTGIAGCGSGSGSGSDGPSGPGGPGGPGDPGDPGGPPPGGTLFTEDFSGTLAGWYINEGNVEIDSSDGLPAASMRMEHPPLPGVPYDIVGPRAKSLQKFDWSGGLTIEWDFRSTAAEAWQGGGLAFHDVDGFDTTVYAAGINYNGLTGMFEFRLDQTGFQQIVLGTFPADPSVWTHLKIVILPDLRVQYHVDGALCLESTGTVGAADNPVPLVFQTTYGLGETWIDNVEVFGPGS